MSSLDDGATTVLAVASGGGHWEQLMLLRPTLDRFATTYVTTNADVVKRDGISTSLVIPDSNRHVPMAVLRTVFSAARIVIKVRPKVVVTTGALPGLACLVLARLLGARTVWIDSLANSERLSISGRFARSFSSVWLTQWPKVSEETGAQFSGCLL